MSKTQQDSSILVVLFLNLIRLCLCSFIQETASYIAIITIIILILGFMKFNFFVYIFF